jgi:hypothetical protein
MEAEDEWMQSTEGVDEVGRRESGAAARHPRVVSRSGHHMTVTPRRILLVLLDSP